MASREIKTQLVLDGEKQYREGLKQAYEAVSKLGRQVKVAEAAFIGNANSMEANAAKAAALKKEIEAQKSLIKSLADRLDEIKDKYGDNTEAQELYADKISKALKALQKMERELDETEGAMRDMDKATDDSADSMRRAEREMDDLGDAARRTSDSVDKLKNGFSVMKGALANLTADAIREGAQALKTFAGDSLELASSIQEVENVVTTAFGAQSEEIERFATEAIGQFGLSALKAQEYAGKLGAAFNALGLEEEALEMSKALTGLTGDLASFWNMSADEAYIKLFSGVISGETEGLKSLGIVMTETNLQAFALEQGIKKKTSAMTADEKAMLRYKYVMEMTSQAQGDFAKTSGSYANQLRVAGLSLDNLKTSFGTGMLPGITAVIEKMNELMSLDIVGSTFEQAGERIGELAETSFQALIDALNWISKNKNSIKAAFTGLGTAIGAIKIAGLVSSLSGLVTQLTTAGSAVSAFTTLLGANPYVVAAAGVAGLAAALVTLVEDAETLNTKLQNITIDISDETTQNITEGINAGIAAADAEHEIILQATVETENIKTKLDEMFSPDSTGGTRLAWKEYKEISNYVRTVVQNDVNTANTLLEQQKISWQERLAALTNPDGTKVYSQEEIDAAVATLSTQTQTLIDNLNGAYKDYDALLKAIYQKRESPTAEETAEIEALLERIQQARVELQSLFDEEMAAAEASERLVLAGRGTEEDFGRALGVIQRREDIAIAEAEDVYRKTVSELNQIIKQQEAVGEDTSKAVEAIAAAAAMRDAAIANAVATSNAETSALFDGLAKQYPEALAELERLEELATRYAELDSKFAQGMDDIDILKSFEGIDIKSLLPKLSVTQEDIQSVIDTNDGFFASSIVQEIREALQTELASADVTLDDNPIMAGIKSMLETNTLTAEDLDLTSLSGTLKTALTSAEFLTQIKEAGTDIIGGLALGMGESASGLTAEDLAPTKDGVISALRTLFDMHSPARVMIPLGEDIIAGVMQPFMEPDISAGMEALKTAITGNLETMTEDMQQTGGKMVESLAAGIRTRAPQAASAARSAMQGITSAASAYSNTLYSVGSNVISGLVQGMESQRYNAISTAESIMQAVNNAARNTLQIHSPSRVFMSHGENTIRGFIVGVENERRNLENTMTRAMQSVIPAETRAAGSVPVSAAGVDAPASGGIQVTQNIYANSTSYAAQQREAARQFRAIARRL